MKHRRIISTKPDVDYYVPVDILNVADELHVTDPQPGLMRGYGGRPLNFDMDDGTHEVVTGPWHTNSVGFFKDTGINVGELHFSKVTLRQDDEIIYDEKEYVLGHFYRGYRMARQLAIVRNKPIWVRSVSNGGSSIHTEYPDKPEIWHPLSMREGDKVK